MCTNLLKGANIEGEDEQEDTIQDMEGSFCCCKTRATQHFRRVETASLTSSLLRLKKKFADLASIDCSNCYLGNEPENLIGCETSVFINKIRKLNLADILSNYSLL